MRTFVIIAGTVLTLGAKPAAACDLELIGGAQRFNAFAAYGAAHASGPISVDRDDRKQELRSEPELERAADTPDASAKAERVSPFGAPAPSATFR